MLIRIIIAMVAFAGNSVLCRLALKGMHADAISFSSLRLISGAIALFLFIAITSDSRKFEFKWLNALLLCIYVFSFSIAYVSLSTGAGALLLFGTVQLVMTVWGIAQGEKLVILKITGILGALAGIAILLLPGAERPSLYAAIMMVIAGLAWAFYSITGKKITDAPASTGGNFILAIPVALIIPFSSSYRYIWISSGRAFWCNYIGRCISALVFIAPLTQVHNGQYYSTQRTLSGHSRWDPLFGRNAHRQNPSRKRHNFGWNWLSYFL